MINTHTCCEIFQAALDENSICYSPKLREYEIPIPDGGSSFFVINYCPWCSEKLPKELRDEWFDLLDEMNKEPADIAGTEFDSDEWWIKRKL